MDIDEVIAQRTDLIARLQVVLNNHMGIRGVFFGVQHGSLTRQTAREACLVEYRRLRLADPELALLWHAAQVVLAEALI